MKKLIILLVMVFLIPNVLAQENEVCLVYFTGSLCGDECGLTNTFMNGLMGEYSAILTAITYDIDASQENKDVFETYRGTYGLPSGVPLVLFGEDDYLLGKNDIYRNTERKILIFLGQEGTNCPLESGYVPPSDLDPSDLPGQPEVFESEQDEIVEEETEEDVTEEETVPEGTGIDIVSVIEDAAKSEFFPEVALVTAVFIILIFAISIAFGRKSRIK